VSTKSHSSAATVCQLPLIRMLVSFRISWRTCKVTYCQ